MWSRGFCLSLAECSNEVFNGHADLLIAVLIPPEALTFIWKRGMPIVKHFLVNTNSKKILLNENKEIASDRDYTSLGSPEISPGKVLDLAFNEMEYKT